MNVLSPYGKRYKICDKILVNFIQLHIKPKNPVGFIQGTWNKFNSQKSMYDVEPVHHILGHTTSHHPSKRIEIIQKLYDNTVV